jgi:hypothetical protein
MSMTLYVSGDKSVKKSDTVVSYNKLSKMVFKNTTREALYESYTTLYVTLMKNKLSRKYVTNNRDIQDTIQCVCSLLQAFPRIVNRENQETINTIDIRLKNTLVKIQNPQTQVVVFSKISNELFHILVQYTGANLLIQNVINHKEPSKNYTIEDIYDLFNDVKPVVQVGMLSQHTFLIEFLQDAHAKMFQTLLNNTLITYEEDTQDSGSTTQSGNKVPFQNEIETHETIKATYIETAIQTHKIVFEWSTKTNTEYYYSYHLKKCVPIQQILDISEMMRTRI